MILDDEEANPDKYKGKNSVLAQDTDFDEEDSVEYTKAYFKKALLPKMILVCIIFLLNSVFFKSQRMFLAPSWM